MTHIKTLLATGLVSTSVMAAASADSKFQEHLTADYNTLSALEVHTVDLDDTRHLKTRAVQTASGQVPMPLEVQQWSYDSHDYEALSDARSDLVRVLGAGAKHDMPRLAARAQSSFDCMVIHAQEHMRNHNLTNCTGAFVETMRELNAAYPDRNMVAEYSVKLPVAKRTVPQINTQNIGFALDSYALDSADKRALDGVVNTIRQRDLSTVELSGFADTTGTESYNDWISKKRVESVVSYLESQLDTNVTFKTNAFGEDNLPLETRDGVANPKNRIVKITY